MASKYFLTLAACFLFAYADVIPLLEGNKIKISTGTGAFCGDTVNFVTNHLVPTYNQYKEFLEIEFVPWGRATLYENGTIECRWGNNDCWANRVHRCAINHLKDDQDALVAYMGCEFSQRHAWLGSYGCVHQIGLNLVEIDYCVNNPGLDTLDEDAAAAASGPVEVLDFIPSVVFNDQINQTLHTAALQRLNSLVCFSLAEAPETGVFGCPIL